MEMSVTIDQPKARSILETRTFETPRLTMKAD